MAKARGLPSPSPAALEHTAGWLDLKITNGAYSSVFLAEVARHLEQRTQNILAILDEVGALEGATFSRQSSTKRETRFKRPPLKGLWHKHYRQSGLATLYINLLNHWNDDRLDRLEREQGQSGPANPEDAAGKLIHDMVLGGDAARSAAREVTGEWIVFARHEGANYFLTLGKHGDDDAVAARVSACAAEFPHVPGLRL